MVEISNKLRRKRGMHPNSLKNLVPFKKGEVHSPNGRPKKADCLLDCIKEELAKVSLNGKDTNEQLIAAALVSMASRGNTKAIELLMSYTSTKPTAQVDVTSKGEAVKSFVFALPDGVKKTASELANAT